MSNSVETNKAPKAIGPYSQAVISGKFIFCSGQIAIDPATNVFIGGDIEQQTRHVIENLKAVLEAAESSLNNVVKTTVYLVNMEDFKEMNLVYAEYFKNKPARATVAVKTLPKDALIEIDCIAEL